MYEQPLKASQVTVPPWAVAVGIPGVGAVIVRGSKSGSVSLNVRSRNSSWPLLTVSASSTASGGAAASTTAKAAGACAPRPMDVSKTSRRRRRRISCISRNSLCRPVQTVRTHVGERLPSATSHGARQRAQATCSPRDAHANAEALAAVSSPRTPPPQRDPCRAAAMSRWKMSRYVSEDKTRIGLGIQRRQRPKDSPWGVLAKAAWLAKRPRPRSLGLRGSARRRGRTEPP